MKAMKPALVTGASRGVGKGVAIAIASSGYKVFATGRTIRNTTLPETITRIPCDHTRDDEASAAFKKIAAESDQLEILVNNAWGGYERMVENGQFTWSAPFWDQPAHRWTSMMDAGVRAAFTCSANAVRMMIPRRRGLIVNIGFWAAQEYVGNTIYGIAKAATDKMSSDTACELRDNNIAVISLYPGMVRTEAVLAAAEQGWLDLSNSESPEFIGHVIAALASDPNLMEKSGKVLIAAAEAIGYEVTDSGKQPRPLTLDDITTVRL